MKIISMGFPYYLSLLFCISITFSGESVKALYAELPLCCSLPNGGYVTNFDCSAPIPLKENGTHFVHPRWRSPGFVLFPEENSTSVFDLRHRPQRPLICIKESLMEIPLEDVVDRQVHLTKVSRREASVETVYVRINLTRKEAVYYNPNEFCVNKLNDSAMTVRLCDSHCWNDNDADDNDEVRSTACVRKCCDMGKSFKNLAAPGGTVHIKCHPDDDEEFLPKLYSSINRPLSKEDKRQLSYHIKKGSPDCPNNTVKLMSTISKVMGTQILGFTSNLCYRVLTSGHFYFQDGKGVYRPTLPRGSDYCIDRMQDFRNSTPKDQDYMEYVAVTCSLPPQKAADDSANMTRKLYGGLLFCSSLFLLFTFIVYSLLWDQHGLHGWTTLGHSGSMFLMYLFLGSSHIMSVTGESSGLGCIIVAVLAHFFFIATFCWLTLISFDLWYTFRSFNPKSTSKRIKRFIFYMLFGWGVPATVVVTSLILDKQYKNIDCPDAILPQYGQRSCYVNPLALGEYIYYPIAALLFLNLLFFGVTTFKLYQYKESTRIATNNLENKRQFFKLFLKLFCVMGITWMFEVISWLHVGTEMTWYWQIVDCVNVCQAIAIFVIYVCKKETVLALEKRYPSLKVILDPFIRLFNCRNSPIDAEQSSSLNSSMRLDKTRASVLSKFSRQSTQIRNSSTTTTSD